MNFVKGCSIWLYLFLYHLRLGCWYIGTAWFNGWQQVPCWHDPLPGHCCCDCCAQLQTGTWVVGQLFWTITKKNFFIECFNYDLKIAQSLPLDWIQIWSWGLNWEPGVQGILVHEPHESLKKTGIYFFICIKSFRRRRRSTMDVCRIFFLNDPCRKS